MEILTENQETIIVAETRDGFIHAEPLDMCKRIDSTVYEVEVYVKECIEETAEEKIMRLIRNDLNLAPGHGKMSVPQTGRLPERGSA